MKILIIDRDEAVAHLMKSRLAPVGHTVEVMGERYESMETVLARGWDVVILDPSPLTMLNPIVLNIKKAGARAPYILLCSSGVTYEDALRAGVNDYLPKPLNFDVLVAMIENADRILAVQRHLADEREDFPNAGGVISKGAFNQLFLTSMERADRYGEVAHVLFISFENYKNICIETGIYEADMVVAKLAQHLVRLRRQSDIIAQTRKNEYALLLLRPLTESEPIEAANRFAESLSRCTDLPLTTNMTVEIRVSLMRLPTGDVGVEHRMDLHR